MRTPAGAFTCSDEFVNWLEQAVRRTVVNHMTYLPNDPVREWKAWTQDIQNMFGSAFYLFSESQATCERREHDLLVSDEPVTPSPYEVVWDSPSPDCNGTMPLGNGEIAHNAWIEPAGDLRVYIWISSRQTAPRHVI